MSAFDFAAVPTLETDRLRLRPITAADRDDWQAVFHSPGVLDYLIEFDSAPRAGAMDEIVDWAERIFTQGVGIRWAIALKLDAKMIGSCGFHLYDRRHARAEIGYELHSSFWRRGIMSEALGALLAFCFVQLRLHRVEADVTEGNAASAALLKKMGFRLEGVWCERERGRGVHHSMWQFGLLAPEYHAGRGRRKPA